MTIFEYLYGDVYYTDEYGNAYFDSCVDIDYELDEIPEIVNFRGSYLISWRRRI